MSKRKNSIVEYEESLLKRTVWVCVSPMVGWSHSTGNSAGAAATGAATAGDQLLRWRCALRGACGVACVSYPRPLWLSLIHSFVEVGV